MYFIIYNYICFNMHDVQAKNNNNVKDIKHIDGLMPQPSNNKICIFQETIFFLIGFVLFD